jgi:hypothetical protein
MRLLLLLCCPLTSLAGRRPASLLLLLLLFASATHVLRPVGRDGPCFVLLCLESLPPLNVLLLMHRASKCKLAALKPISLQPRNCVKGVGKDSNI